MAIGIRIQHTDPKSANGSRVYTIPILSQPLWVHVNPIVGVDECDICGVIHPVKTIHLHMDDRGECIVSEGVLKLIQEKADPTGSDGLAFANLRVAGFVKSPPPLNVRNPRVLQDQKNRQIQQWS